MKETKDKRPDSSEETHDNSPIKGKFYRTMKRHPLVTGGLVLAGAGLAFTAVKLATNGSATQEDERDGVARGVHLETSIAINRSPEELYGIWRDLKMLPLIMTNLESVTDLGNGRSHWVLKITNGVRVKWDAETIQDKANQLIAWRSVGDAEVNNAGSVRFQPGPEGRGTYVRVALNYEPPVGKLGAGVAHLLGYDPEALIKRDLQQFKQMMETGEIATIEGQPSGREAESESDAPRKLSTMGNQSESAAGQGEARPRDAGGRRKMKAVCWNGKHNVQVSNVPDPAILNPNDAIVKVTTTAICGSDLHLYDGYIPTMERGDILGHEFMGVVVETGSAVKKLRIGDRVVVPFTIACGKCFFCRKGLTSACDNSNPNASTAEALYGFSGSGLFGYSHMMGGYAGGQAEFVRVPFADVGPIVIPDGLSDEQVLFLSDIFPTGYMAAENCNIQPGDTVAVWGCGPVGQFAIKSAFLLGAERVIAIDQVPGRLRMAAAEGKADTLNFDDVDIFDKLSEMTGGLGPDACIDAVGLEAHGATIDALYDRAKTALNLATDRLHALRQAIRACRKGGTVSVPGVYGGFLDKFPFGAAFAKGLTFKMGQTNVHKYLHPLLGLIQEEKIDPSFVISHRIRLDDAASAYEAFKNNKDEWTKVVMKPDLN